jgi:hypothetical protein
VLKNRMDNICVRSSICVRDWLEMHQDQMKLWMKDRYTRRRRLVNTTSMMYGPGPRGDQHACACACALPPPRANHKVASCMHLYVGPYTYVPNAYRTVRVSCTVRTT